MQTALEYIHSELQGLYPLTEIRSFGLLILEKLSGLSRTDILLNKNTIFSTEQRQELASIIQKLKKNVPIQYILGETEFYGLTFRVDNTVLIPRPETEELVDWIIAEHKGIEDLRILDIGTGSGCIAIALQSSLQRATVDAFDISEEALATAKTNAMLNKQSIQFSKIDILHPPTIDKKWDIIVSNPPYITEQEKAEIMPNVLNHEPHLALFVPDDHPLLFYKEITLFARDHLHPKGKLYFEVHRDFGIQCVELLKTLGWSDIELRRDISGNDRMVRAELTVNAK
jgi:release factor glutamine methyltransferase